MRTLKRVVEPVVEALTLSDLKEWLPQAEGVDEAKISGMIVSARRELENYLQRAFANQTWDLGIDAENIENVLYLPRPPLVGVSYIKSYSTANVESTVNVLSYTVELGEAARIWLNDGYAWPTDLRSHRALAVAYTSGYGVVPGDIPVEIRKAIKELVTLDYWHPLTGRVNPDGADVDDLDKARAQVFSRVAHLKTTWVVT